MLPSTQLYGVGTPKRWFRGSIAPPTRTPANASPTPSRTPAH